MEKVIFDNCTNVYFLSLQRLNVKIQRFHLDSWVARPPYGYLSTVTLQCNAGYTMIGSATVTCELNGQWSPGLPQCIRKSKIKIIICKCWAQAWSLCSKCNFNPNSEPKSSCCIFMKSAKKAGKWRLRGPGQWFSAKSGEYCWMALYLYYEHEYMDLGS